jgi:photosystem II stability/assembly factor-like uncharacterized protein
LALGSRLSRFPAWRYLVVVLAALAVFGAYFVAQRQAPDADIWNPPEAGSWAWWAFPVERNSFLRNRDLFRGAGDWSAPASQPLGDVSAYVRSVAFADAQHAVAVGDEGTILATRDGGASWQAVSSGTRSYLTSVAFADAQHAVAVGDEGTILATRDGGASWQAMTSGTRSLLLSVAFADAQHAVAVGDEGTILATRDGGASWQAVSSGTQSHLRSVAFADVQHAVAVGREGTILATRDGGASWQQSEYARGPAPWFWLVCVALIGGASLLVFRRPHPRLNLAGASAEADAPIDRAAQDRLNLGLIARGLSDYLRSEGTQPPLVISVAAPWGAGKSSLMRLLQAEMAALGVRSVWFNAWHHQHEPLLLPPLLEAIRDQAIPFWMSPAGLRFHARLLWQRARRRPWRALLLTLAAGAPIFWFGWPAALRDGLSKLGSTPITEWPAALVAPALSALLNGGAALSQSVPALLLFAGDFSAVAEALLATFNASPDAGVNTLLGASLLLSLGLICLYGCRAFPERSAVLLAGLAQRFKVDDMAEQTSLAQRFKVGDMAEQTSFLQRFRQHFGDVTAALLPRAMLIFIDDVDRCTPEKAVQMLEATNYLADAGRCVIVLGLADDVVVAQVANEFAAVAKQQAAIRQQSAEGAEEPVEGAEERYSRRYLRKLINLRVRLSALDQAGLARFLDEPVAASQHERLAARFRFGLESWRRTVKPAVLLLAALAAGGVLTKVALDTVQQWRDKQTKSVAARVEVMKKASQNARDAALCASGAAAKSVSGTADALPPCAVYLTTVAVGKKPSASDSTWRRLRLDFLAAEANKAAAEADKAAGRSIESETKKAASRAESAAREALVLAGYFAQPSGKGSPDSGPVASDLEESGAARMAAPMDAAAATASTDWTPIGLGVPFVLLLVWLFVRGERYLIVDRPSFRVALNLWCALLAADPDRATPRELRRFENMARYFAMRLRPRWDRVDRVALWTLQLHRLMRCLRYFYNRQKWPPRVERVEPASVVPEDLIVGLTALYQLNPRLLYERALFDAFPHGGGADYLLSKAIDIARAHCKKRDEQLREQEAGAQLLAEEILSSWPPTAKQREAFLRVAGEFSGDDAPSPASPEPTLRLAG